VLQEQSVSAVQFSFLHIPPEQTSPLSQSEVAEQLKLQDARGVEVGVGVLVTVGVAVGVAVTVKVPVGVSVGVADGADIEKVNSEHDIRFGGRVGVGVPVSVGVLVGVSVGEEVKVPVGVLVGDCVGVFVDDGQSMPV